MTRILASLLAQVPEVLGMARGHGLLREGRGDGEWAQLPQVLGMARGHGLGEGEGGVWGLQRMAIFISIFCSPTALFSG